MIVNKFHCSVKILFLEGSYLFFTLALIFFLFYFIRRTRGDPEPVRAMSLVNSEIFDRHGDRDKAPNYVVLVTRHMGNEETVTAVNKLKTKGTKIVGVGQSLFYILKSYYPFFLKVKF